MSLLEVRLLPLFGLRPKETKNGWLLRYAALGAACCFSALTTGTAVTSNEDRPLYSLGQWHVPLGVLAGMLIVGLAILYSRRGQRGWLRTLGWIVSVGILAECLLGLPPLPQPPALRVVHALLGQLLFASVVAMVVFNSSVWQRAPDGSRVASPLWLARIAPVVVLAQVSLGVAHRHGLMGVLWHVLGALTIGIFIGVTAMIVIYRPEHQALRSAGVTLVVLTCVQFFLGLFLLAIQTEDLDPAVTIWATVVHAGVGASTLGASVVLAVLAESPARASELAASVEPGASRDS